MLRIVSRTSFACDAALPSSALHQEPVSAARALAAGGGGGGALCATSFNARHSTSVPESLRASVVPDANSGRRALASPNRN